MWSCIVVVVNICMGRAQTELKRYPGAARTPITMLGSRWKPCRCMLLLWHAKCCTVAHTYTRTLSIRCEPLLQTSGTAVALHRCSSSTPFGTSCDLYARTFQYLRALCACASFCTYYNWVCFFFVASTALLATLHYILLIWAALHTIETPFYSNARALYPLAWFLLVAAMHALLILHFFL